MDGPRNPRGVGLDVRLNNKATVKLLLDTGASGISISPKLAEKAGLQPLVPETSLTRGIGDQAPQSAQTYLAPEVRAGSVIFADVPIRAFTSATSSDIDGLIGADVFERFLISIDFAAFELQLEPRPGETAEAPLQPSNAVTPHAPGFHGVFRFSGHMVIPTGINHKRMVLFLIDSGSTSNLIDTAAAREFTHVAKDSQTIVRGVQGKVDQVSRADRITLTFAGFQQDNADLIAVSLDKMSDSLGVEISGVLGMPVLERMRMTLDYKEGTVRFEYRQ